ncbi:MAG: sigma-70 family RNA polymerase sigma factor [Candidatus Aminicenantes bacterium]|nr:sigma-70 family RNA polymerase sigma factor [Candidatus Aminicenantes bacterium]
MDAFESIIIRYQKQVMSLAYRIVRNAEDARDVAQGVFIKAFSRLSSYDPGHKFFSWLYRIAVNESLNFVEKRNRRSVPPPVLESAVLDPEDLCEIGELNARINRAMESLHPRRRALLALSIDGLSYKEIGELLGMPEHKVKSRLFEARHRLREILVRDGGLRHA